MDAVMRVIFLVIFLSWRDCFLERLGNTINIFRD